MKKHIALFSIPTLCAAALFAVPALSRAQEATNPPAAGGPPPLSAPPEATKAPGAAKTAPEKKKNNPPPSATPQFHGTVTAVDTNAMTLTVEKRTFEITSETIIAKDGKPAVLADAAVGDSVRGSYKKNAEGKLEAVTLHYSAAPKGKKKESAK
jgi:hypothetical protein